MSRLTRYAHSLASGYLALGANVVFSLVSVPLALHYLSDARFGLWALVMQISGYLALMDFGMSSAVARILIDHKDHPETGEYGAAIKVSVMVGGVQGVIAAGCGVALGLAGAGLLGIEVALRSEYAVLIVGMSCLQAVNFLGRSFTNVLWAHQRTDVSNLVQALVLVVNLGVLWAAFRLGMGVQALLWGQGASTLVFLGLSGLACRLLRLLPAAGQWGRSTWGQFAEIFHFSKDVFLYGLGSQMINTTQTILVAPCIGLEAAAVWTVCTRAFLLLSQVVWRILDFSANPLSEMLVRGERERFLARFRAVTVLTGVMAVAAAAGFIAGNQSFVHLWTRGKISWPVLNDVVLGLWLVAGAIQRCHCGRLGWHKQMQSVKHVLFLEGAVFITAAVSTVRLGGMTAIALCSLAATLCLSFAYGHWQTGKDYHLSRHDLAKWLAPAGIAALWMAGPTGLLVWAADSWPPAVVLGGCVVLLLPLGGWVVFRFGLDEEMRGMLVQKIPGRLGQMLGRKPCG